MSRSEKWKTRVLRTAAVLLCLTVISICATSGLYARYTTETSFFDGARVALWASDQHILLAEDTQLPQQPGETCTYQIAVSNQPENGKISEVTQEYHIEVVTAGNLPLTYTLSKDGTQIGSFTETAQNKIWAFSNEDMTFSAGTAESCLYTLTVAWPSTENSATLSNIPDFIQVRVCIDQVD